MKKHAFTLAEVLITLMIIGIVAALTIPSVISNYQQKEFKTGLKKAVSVLNEAIQLNIVQEGETPYENVSLSNYLKRHMSVIDGRVLRSQSKPYSNTAYSYVCTGSGKNRRCHDEYTTFTDYVKFTNDVFYTTDGMRYEVPREGLDLLLHETGLSTATSKTGLGVDLYSPGNFGQEQHIIAKRSVKNGFCGAYGLSTNPNRTINTPCVIVVDINGDKKPNPPVSFISPSGYSTNGVYYEVTVQEPEAAYIYPSPSDKKLQDVFTIMITDEKAIPFGVVAQRAMYEGK